MLNLSRNLGLITGAAVMGAVFALASGANDIGVASPEAVSASMRITFAVGAMLLAMPLLIAGARAGVTPRPSLSQQPRADAAR